jgi:chemotaxis protein CheC
MANKPLENINFNQLEVFQEIGNIGAGNAATALAGILDKHIDMGVPRAQIVNFDQAVDMVGHPEDWVVGVLIGIDGDLTGSALLILSLEGASQLLSVAMKEAQTAAAAEEHLAGRFSEMEQSALKEISNIVIGACLSAISSMTHLRIIPSVPYISIDMLGAIMSIVTIEYSKIGDSVLFLNTQFFDDDHAISGNFFLVPDYYSYHKLITSLGIEF